MWELSTVGPGANQGSRTGLRSKKCAIIEIRFARKPEQSRAEHQKSGILLLIFEENIPKIEPKVADGRTALPQGRVRG
jgi:hypothetical protein